MQLEYFTFSFIKCYFNKSIVYLQENSMNACVLACTHTQTQCFKSNLSQAHINLNDEFMECRKVGIDMSNCK